MAEKMEKLIIYYYDIFIINICYLCSLFIIYLSPLLIPINLFLILLNLIMHVYFYLHCTETLITDHYLAPSKTKGYLHLIASKVSATFTFRTLR